MAAPVESLPICECATCDKSRKMFGLVLSQCGLFPARNADFLCKPLSVFIHLIQEAISKIGTSMALDGVNPNEVDGWRDVAYAAMLMPLVDDDCVDRILPLAEALAAIHRKNLGTGVGN